MTGPGGDSFEGPTGEFIRWPGSPVGPLEEGQVLTVTWQGEAPTRWRVVRVEPLDGGGERYSLVRADPPGYPSGGGR